MKRLIPLKIAAPMLATLSAVAVFAATDRKYVVTASGLGAESEGKPVYMSIYDTNEYIDTAFVKDGAFRMEGTVPESSFGRLDLGRRYANFIVGEGAVTVDFETHHPVTGNKVNMDYRRISGELKAVDERYSAIIDSIRNCGLPRNEEEAEIERLFKTYMDSQAIYLKDIVMSNGDNGIGEAMAREYANLIYSSPEKWPEFYGALSPWIKKHSVIGYFDKKFNTAIATGKGKMFVDLEGQTPSGAKAMLSDYVGKGKYTLVDFWASWCGPCIAEAKETLKPLYEKYGNRKDFMILGLATWDNNEKTLAAIEKHGLPWTHILTPGNSAMDTYGISGIPMIILFDPQGRIVERNLRGEKLVDVVEKALHVKK